MRIGNRILQRLLASLGVVLALFSVAALVSGWSSFGQRANGARRTRMEASPQWKDGSFNNPEPLQNSVSETVRGLFHIDPNAAPQTPLTVAPVDPARFSTPPASGLRVTWLGHSTLLLELDGLRILTDPVWSDRSSPLSWAGPHRFYGPQLPLEALPPIDLVILSHDHYDHLDRATLVALKDRAQLFICPLGVGAHLEGWGIAPGKIREVDWWERVVSGPFVIIATPARHASGRVLFDKDATLWASYALLGPQHRVWFSGDTGLFDGLREIGEKLGPFDLTMIETGQYHRAWPDWHIGPEQAVLAHQWLRGKAFLPIHWGLFALAYHGWTEPAERSLLASTKARVAILTPRPGESVEPESPGQRVSWWPALPFETAEQHPILSHQVKGLTEGVLPH